MPQYFTIHRKYKLLLCGCLVVSVFLVVIGLFYIHKQRKSHQNIFEIDEYDDDGVYNSRDISVFLDVGLPKRVNPNHFKNNHVSTRMVPKILVNGFRAIHMVDMTPDHTPGQVEDNFYKYLELKEINCLDDRRLGHEHDGGWNVCFSPPLGFTMPCLIYSFGIGDDWGFEDQVSKSHGCQVLAFDPSIHKDDHNRSNLIQFRNLGLGGVNEVTEKGWHLKTLKTHLKDRKHTNATIDYLKFDVEYYEWDCLQSMIWDQSIRNVKQLAFEIHTVEYFKQDMHASKQDYMRMFKLLTQLELMNFKRFNYRKNPFGEFRSTVTGVKRSCCYELFYINMNLVDLKYVLYAS
ncbi:hypothetical protein ScPMuIL_003274 [Solemya velum]